MTTLIKLTKRAVYEAKIASKNGKATRYTQELKYEAVVFLNSNTLSQRAMARTLGVQIYAVQEWVRKFNSKELRQGETSIASSRYPKPRYPKL